MAASGHLPISDPSARPPPGTGCGEHGVRVVKMPWAERSSRFTALMEPLVIDWREAMLTAIAPS